MSNPSLYPLLAIIGVIITSFVWSKIIKPKQGQGDSSFIFIYIVALAGAFLGAKFVYLLAEGWIPLLDSELTGQQKIMTVLVGKSITGALLGGYAAVEWAKKRVGHSEPTGDYFAAIIPIGLMLGRIGCYTHGCCLGVPLDEHWYTLADAEGLHRWPAVPMEFLFNAVMLLFAWACIAKSWHKGQVFHLYLIAYGLFRLAHETLRNTPSLLGPISGYQLAALAIFLLGAIRYYQRSNAQILAATAS